MEVVLHLGPITTSQVHLILFTFLMALVNLLSLVFRSLRLRLSGCLNLLLMLLFLLHLLLNDFFLDLLGRRYLSLFL